MLCFFFSLELSKKKNEKSLIYYFLTKDIKIDVSAIMGWDGMVWEREVLLPFSLLLHLL
jgi:hypothetical protein